MINKLLTPVISDDCPPAILVSSHLDGINEGREREREREEEEEEEEGERWVSVLS